MKQWDFVTKQPEAKLALLEFLLSVQADQRHRHFRLKDLSLQAQTIPFARTRHVPQDNLSV